MKNQNTEEKEKTLNSEKTGEELLQEYLEQDNDKHYYHVDGYYGDHSESSCCC